MKGITLTIITSKIQSVNYGETIGNVSTLKKLSVGTGNRKRLITYFSDKAIKFDVKRIGREMFGWKLMDKSITEIFKKCITKDLKFDDKEFNKRMIREYIEFDLFGGMFADIGGIEKTIKEDIKEEIMKMIDEKIMKMNIKKEEKKMERKIEIEVEKLKRTQPVRFSDGYSISEFVYDMNLINDIDAYNRYIQYIAGQKKQSLVYPEEHFAHYIYTVNMDLDRVGAYDDEENGRVKYKSVFEDDYTTRANRVKELLRIIMFYLNRNIRGRTENLTPVFLIGGVYDVKHPFFMGKINFWEENGQLYFKASDIENVFKNYKEIYQNIVNDTYLYIENNIHVVGELPSGLTIKNLSHIYNKISEKIEEYYRNQNTPDGSSEN